LFDLSPVDVMEFKLLRKSFLQLLAGALGGSALAALTTRRVRGKSAKDPVFNEDWEPGEYRWTPSVCALCPSLCGTRVRQVDAGTRIVKLEGESSHPVNRGALCLLGQASLQHEYNPERLEKSMLRRGNSYAPLPPAQALARAREMVSRAGDNPMVLSRTPPGSVRDLARLLAARLNAAHYGFFPGDSPGLYEQVGFSRPPRLSFKGLRLLLCFEGGILEETPYTMPLLKEFASLKGDSPKGKMIVLSSRQNTASSRADELLLIRPGSAPVVALALLRLLGESGGARGEKTPAVASVLEIASEITPERAAKESGLPPDEIRRIARELGAASPAMALSESHLPRLPGEDGLFSVVAALNLLLGARGRFEPRTSPPSLAGAPAPRSIRPNQLLELWRKKPPSFILHLEGDPVHEMKDRKVARDILAKVPMISLYPYLNETNSLATLRLSTTLPFEEDQILVSDAVPGRVIHAFTRKLVPLGGDVLDRQDALLALLGENAPAENAKAYQADARKKLAKRIGKSEEALKKIVRAKGFQAEAAEKNASPAGASVLRPNPDRVKNALGKLKKRKKDGLWLYPFKTLAQGDGTFSHLPWLRDLGGAHVKEHWRLFAELNPKTAAGLGLADGDIARVKRADGREGMLLARIRLSPVIAEGLLGIPLGYGRTQGGRFSASVRPENLHGLVAPEEWENEWIGMILEKA